MRVLSAQAMQAVDRKAIDELGIPGLVLMENAAIGVVDALGSRYPAASRVAVFCGPGNNGGDGLAVARLLDARGYFARLYLLTGGRVYKGDAGIQRQICERIGFDERELLADSDVDSVADELETFDLIVDALYGTGLTRALEGLPARCVDLLNRSGRPIVAVDVPSGLSGDTAAVIGPHVRADMSVTFGAPKIPHLLPPAADSVGEVVVADLGFPTALIEQADGDLRLFEERDARLLVGPRAPEGHKGSYGHVLVVAGSTGKSGAALLATRAAVRAGAGLVTVAVPDMLLPVLEAASLESMTLDLPSDSEGELGEDAYARVLEAAEERTVVALGPGLGTQASTAELIRRWTKEISRPLVLDADGLNAFAGRIEELAEREAPLVLTPHPAELARLLGVETATVVEDRVEAVRTAAARSGGVVVLKGHRSLTGDSSGITINPTGNPGMATGGTGDVLTGLIAALIAQGRSPVEAAELGVYVHGRAGDLAAEESGELSLTAGDLLEHVPPVLEELVPE